MIDECEILASNPFADVPLPKADKPAPRVLLPQEVASFLDWMGSRWGGWRLAILFLEAKQQVGCRIMELASAASSDLRGGRLHVPADMTKGRKERAVSLPAALYAELRSLAGPLRSEPSRRDSPERRRPSRFRNRRSVGRSGRSARGSTDRGAFCPVLH